LTAVVIASPYRPFYCLCLVAVFLCHFSRGLGLVCSYHVSQQNTFTGRLTPRSFDAVLRKVRAHIERRTPDPPSARLR